MKFAMSRHHVVTGLGHAVEFFPGKATHVPRELHRMVVAAGAQPVDGDEVEFETKTTEVHVPTDPAERNEMLKMALADMRLSEDREIFTANGVPKVKAVATMLGYEVTAAEVGAAWSEMNQNEGK